MEKEIEKRKIDFVWHFTRLENLDSILVNGLIPRENLEQQNLNATFNDAYRLDGARNANCMSIGHPNYKMFYSLRMQFPNQEWVVLACKPSILWLKNCAFCAENAASASVTAIPFEQRKGVEAFNKLFEPMPGKPTREFLKLPNNCPTNPQAEILIFDRIESEYILGAVCQNKARSEELKEKYKNFQFIYHRSLFSARLDYKYWK